MKRKRRILLMVNSGDGDAILEVLRNDPEYQNQVVTVEADLEALKCLREQPPHAVLLSRQDLETDGLEVLRALRQLPDAPPVVLLTGRASRELAFQALEVGAQDFLAKEDLTASILSRALTNAIVKRQLQRGTERLVDRMLRLQEVAALLSASLNPDEVAGIILQQGLQALDARAGFIAILTPDGAYLEIKASAGYPAETIRRWQRIPRQSDVPICEAVRTGEIVLVETLSERDQRFPELAQETRYFASMAAIPMRVGQVTLGALGLSFVEASPFQQEDRDFLNILSHHAAMALERARLFQEAAERTEFEQQLMGIVSHDLRNPLGAIAMGAELLLRRVPGEAVTIKRILSSSERAQRLIADLLDFTQLRLGGGIPIQRQWIDGAAVTAQIVEEVRATNPDYRLVLTREGNADGEWDPDRLAQVVSNLVRNAVQHGDPAAPVLIHLFGDESTVSLTVTNQGEPIPEALLPEIFEPMKRGDHAPEVSRRGVGLGLFIVRSLVEAHKGSIEVSSSRREGTSFRVRLPRRPV